ncbi:hypothetical protein [Clostridium botulinum]|uniref:hypothetical protein n=1 Tax=Clostridium botulinum TaxID=1491 RepID=UPI001968A42B|nr:hypothetical protein [Clostridium botulinum]MBN1050277.1 hypothetical protein [Clostridium botulinum]
MFIQNYNLRKRLGMSKFMEADTGVGGAGESGTEETTTEETEEVQEETVKDKTFTQADVDKLVKDRLAREKKGQPSKEELKAFKDWQDSQKTESQKKDEALTGAEKKMKEAENRALLAETKVTCLSKGVVATSVDDVVVLAKAMISVDVTMEQAIDKVLEKYPNFKGEQEEQKGFKKIGGKGGSTKTNQEDALKAIFGIKNK